MPGASVRLEDNGRAHQNLLPPGPSVHQVARGPQGCPSHGMFPALHLAGPPGAVHPPGGLTPQQTLKFLLLQADPRGLGSSSGCFPSMAGNGVVTVETKAPEGIGAAFLPVPPAHTWNWVSGHCLVPEQGSAVHCRLLFRQRERRCQKSATTLSPAFEPRVLGGGRSSEDLEALQ